MELVQDSCDSFSRVLMPCDGAPDTDGAASPTQGFVPIKNKPPGQDGERAYHVISPDALALVRFGLRDANDPRIVNTVRVSV